MPATFREVKRATGELFNIAKNAPNLPFFMRSVKKRLDPFTIVN